MLNRELIGKVLEKMPKKRGYLYTTSRLKSREVNHKKEFNVTDSDPLKSSFKVYKSLT